MANTFDSWYEAMQSFDETLDTETISIADAILNPSEVLKELRPTSYRTHLYDWLDSMGEETDEWDDLDVLP